MSTIEQAIIEQARTRALANYSKVELHFFLPVLAEFNYCCAVCGESNPYALQREHVTARANGGSNEAENLQVLCAICNNVKNDLVMSRFEPRQPESLSFAKIAAQTQFRIECDQLRRA